MLKEKLKKAVRDTALIRDMKISAYTVPTGHTQSDGTLEWHSNTLVLVEIESCGRIGIGYTYGDISTALFIKRNLKPVVIGEDAFNIPAINRKLTQLIRNQGPAGIAMMAVSAVDIALWDLKAKILQLSLVSLLGQARSGVSIYGSGGFTSYSVDQLKFQLAGWVSKGIQAVKMKVGRQPEFDVSRIKAAREAIGEHVKLYVDANGAYSVKQAIGIARQFDAYNVAWYEEPVSPDNPGGLRFIRENISGAVNIVAGECSYNLPHFNQILQSRAVDILQADVTRCGGISGFLKVGGLCEAWQIPLSSHSAPSLHVPVAVALPCFYEAEYFHDHVRIEEMLFDGVQLPHKGVLKPDLSRPGLGLKFKHNVAEKYRH